MSGKGKGKFKINTSPKMNKLFGIDTPATAPAIDENSILLSSSKNKFEEDHSFFIFLTIHAARNIRKYDHADVHEGKLYALVTIGSRQNTTNAQRSQFVEKNQNPVWNQSFAVKAQESDQQFSVVIYAENTLRTDTVIGHLTLDIPAFQNRVDDETRVLGLMQFQAQWYPIVEDWNKDTPVTNLFNIVSSLGFEEDQDSMAGATSPRTTKPKLTKRESSTGSALLDDMPPPELKLSMVFATAEAFASTVDKAKLYEKVSESLKQSKTEIERLKEENERLNRANVELSRTVDDMTSMIKVMDNVDINLEESDSRIDHGDESVGCAGDQQKQCIIM